MRCLQLQLQMNTKNISYNEHNSTGTVTVTQYTGIEQTTNAR